LFGYRKRLVVWHILKFSLIHGPPGTGKTYTLAAAAVEICYRESGTIVVCTPSNAAADQFATTITNISQNFHLKISMLRMLSKRRENAELFATMRGENVPTFYENSCLHREIQNSNKWLKGKVLSEISESKPDVYVNFPKTMCISFVCISIL
jgi:Rad3-related DNA helicase